MAERLQQLRPIVECAGLHVGGPVGGRKRRQQNREHDERRHRHKPALPEIPACVASQLDACPRCLCDGARVVRPQQEGEGEDEDREHVALLVVGDVEHIGGERGGAGDQAEERLPPAQNAPAQPASGHPHQPADQEEVERVVLNRAPVNYAAPPRVRKAEAERLRRMRRVHCGPRSVPGRERTDDHSHPESGGPRDGQQREESQHDRARERDHRHDLDAVDPVCGDRRLGDGKRQQEHDDGGPQHPARQARAGSSHELCVAAR